MNQIVFTLLFISVVYVKLINGQILTPCQRAEQNLAANEICVNAYMAANDSNLVCNGTCRSLYDAYLGVCGGSLRTTLRNAIFGLCDPCGIPQEALTVGDPSCTDYIFRRNVTAICTGTCRSLIDDIVDNCENTTSAFNDYSEILDARCSPCGMAQTNLDLNFDCFVAYSSARDADAVCTGTCRTLGDAIVTNCDASVSSTYASTINSLCSGTNTGSCETAFAAVDVSCINLLNNSRLFCSGLCGRPLYEAVTACESSTDPQIQAVVLAFDQQCGSGNPCAAAIRALEDEASCHTMDDPRAICSEMCTNLLFATVEPCNHDDTVLRASYDRTCGTNTGNCKIALQALAEETSCNSTDQNVICSAGSCRTLYSAAFDACPTDDTANAMKENYNRICGSGSMSRASVIITLLLVAMQALILK